jgi:prevent-host-death family protein
VGGKRYSVAEARQNFARLIRAAERGRAVEITRRGEPVAVLLSASEYLALSGERRSFVQAIDAIRERLGVDRLGIGDEEFAGLRDDSPGREVSL